MNSPKEELYVRKKRVTETGYRENNYGILIFYETIRSDADPQEVERYKFLEKKVEAMNKEKAENEARKIYEKEHKKHDEAKLKEYVEYKERNNKLQQQIKENDEEFKKLGNRLPGISFMEWYENVFPNM